MEICKCDHCNQMVLYFQRYLSNGVKYANEMTDDIIHSTQLLSIEIDLGQFAV